ncbi:hypothetical protein [Brevibacillus porteri]|uniref:hypothetical protein n=1 Tax=Brevibacillus porteri TaxID=2126350 RepID=UPI003D1D94F8
MARVDVKFVGIKNIRADDPGSDSEIYGKLYGAAVENNGNERDGEFFWNVSKDSRVSISQGQMKVYNIRKRFSVKTSSGERLRIGGSIIEHDTFFGEDIMHNHVDRFVGDDEPEQILDFVIPFHEGDQVFHAIFRLQLRLFSNPPRPFDPRL